MKIIEVQHGSRQYQEMVSLRYDVLRAPLGLSFSAEQLAAESDSLHLAAYDGERIVGCLILAPSSKAGEIKMRQVAVRTTGQRLGVGSALVAFSEELSRGRGFHTMVLHARESAVPFYLRLGYSIVGEPFEEVTIPHRRMQKSLTLA